MDSRDAMVGECEALVLDFDGTMFRLFVNYDLAALSVRLHGLLVDKGVDFDAALDPFQVFGLLDGILDEALRRTALEIADAEVSRAEIEALDSGVAIAHCAEVLCELVCEGVPVAVATNNSVACVRAWLEQNVGPGVADAVDAIPVFGRETLYPEHLKPSPWMVTRAAEALGVVPGACLYVGDTARDFEAARACGCAFLGLSHSEGKRRRLLGFLREEDVVTDWRELRLRLGA